MKVSVLVENKTYRPGISAEHGLALLLETAGRTILFDSGQTDAVVRNAQAMEIDLAQVDLAVLSHGHFDHSGGFPAFCEKNKTAPIYIHQNAFGTFFDSDEQGNSSAVPTGVAWSYSQLKARIRLTKSTVWIDKDLVLSGSANTESHLQGDRFWCRKPDGSLELDSMDHEQFLAVRENNDVYLFSGCSHKGIGNVIGQAEALFPDARLKAVFAGLHFVRMPPDQLRKTILALDRTGAVIAPLHCTGFEGICELEQSLGPRCRILHAGDMMEL